MDNLIIWNDVEATVARRQVVREAQPSTWEAGIALVGKVTSALGIESECYGSTAVITDSVFKVMDPSTIITFSGTIRCVSEDVKSDYVLFVPDYDLIVELEDAADKAAYLAYIILKEYVNIPFASISNFTLICGIPLGAGGMLSNTNLPSVLLSLAIGLSPCKI